MNFFPHLRSSALSAGKVFLLFAFLCGHCSAQNTLTNRLQNANQTAASNNIVTLTPSSLNLNGAHLVGPQLLQETTDTNGYFGFTNIVSGSYTLRITGTNGVSSTCIITNPTGSAVFNITNIIASAVIPAFNAGWTRGQSDARYESITNDLATTNQVATNAFPYQWTNAGPFAVNTLYTNVSGQREWLAISGQFVNTILTNGNLWLLITNLNGVIVTNFVSGQPGVASTNNWTIGDQLDPGAKWVISNYTGSGASATILSSHLTLE